jgi:hypothetical protein
VQKSHCVKGQYFTGFPENLLIEIRLKSSGPYNSFDKHEVFLTLRHSSLWGAPNLIGILSDILTITGSTPHASRATASFVHTHFKGSIPSQCTERHALFNVTIRGGNVGEKGSKMISLQSKNRELPRVISP